MHSGPYGNFAINTIFILNCESAILIKEILNKQGYQCEIINTFNEPELEALNAAFLIIDISNGIQILKQINNISYITICNRENFELAIESLQMGAYTCLSKPIKTMELISATQNILQFNRRSYEIAQPPLIAKSKAMQVTIKNIKELKQAHTISLLSPIGCGKKFLAQYFGNLWHKKVKLINCDNINMNRTLNKLEYLLNDSSSKLLVINHPERLNPNLQRQLASIIHSTIGQSYNQWISVIDIADENNLTDSLYERIGIFNVNVPDISQRQADLTDIAKLIQKRIAKSLNKKIRKLDMQEISNRKWEGNFKELKTYLEQLFYINNKIDTTENADILIDEMFLEMNLKDATNLFEQTYLNKQIASKQGMIKKAATIAEINRTTLYRKLKKNKKT